MIEIKDVNFNYKGSEYGRLKDISLTVQKGEAVLLYGSSGAGKTSILRLINGLIPHFYKGDLSGSVTVDGKDILTTPLYDLAGIVGTVFQNPRSQFFSIDTDGEIVFGTENIGLPPKEIKKRKDIVTKDMDLSPLLSRSLFELSGGEKQKIACASVAALIPDVIILDEPSSNLDWKAIDELRRIIKLWRSQGKTIIISEHRLWYVSDLVDRVLLIEDGSISREWTKDEFQKLGDDMMRSLKLRPLSVDRNLETVLRPHQKNKYNNESIVLKDFYFTYDKKQHLFGRKKIPDESLTLYIPRLELQKGSVIGLVGYNGAGKSTLLRCICGLEKNCKGQIIIDGNSYKRRKAIDISYLVMQDVNHQLFTDSVLSEVLLSMKEPSSEAAHKILESVDLDDYADTHPMALSGGQKQRVAIASAIAAKAKLLLFDEPTSGLDYVHMCSVARLLRKLADSGRTVLVSTHDPELLTLCADHVVRLEHGRVKR